MQINQQVLQGKVAIVTGGTRGIGFGLATSLARAGADLTVVSRNREQAQQPLEALRSLGGRVLYVEADVTKANDLQRMVEETIKEYGKIDILVNNAGTTMTKPVLETTEEDWDRVIDTNLKSVFFACREVGKIMVSQKQGKIINIASISAKSASPLIAPYCASKAGVVQLTKALALEWARYHINVNAIGPGYVKTDMNKDILENEKLYQSIINRIPFRSLAKEDDLAGALIYLASEASNYVTGHTIFVDGGWMANQ